MCTEEEAVISYEQNYLRETVKDLAHLDKPVILRAIYKKTDNESVFITFRSIHPYKKDIEKTKRICDHINFFQDQFYLIYGEKWNACLNHEQPVFLICRPYIYFDKRWHKRGGFRLTGELGMPPIQTMEKYIREIPEDQYVDFAAFQNGDYLHPGKNESEEEYVFPGTVKRQECNEIFKSKKHKAKDRRREKQKARFRSACCVEHLISVLTEKRRKAHG